jgi:hypothetical protein
MARSKYDAADRETWLVAILPNSTKSDVVSNILRIALSFVGLRLS